MNISRLSPSRRLTGEEGLAILFKAGLVPGSAQGGIAKAWTMLTQEKDFRDLCNAFVSKFAGQLISAMHVSDRASVMELREEMSRWYVRNNRDRDEDLPDAPPLMEHCMCIRLGSEFKGSRPDSPLHNSFFNLFSSWAADSPDNTKWLVQLAQETVASLTPLTSQTHPSAGGGKEQSGTTSVSVEPVEPNPPTVTEGDPSSAKPQTQPTGPELKATGSDRQANGQGEKKGPAGLLIPSLETTLPPQEEEKVEKKEAAVPKVPPSPPPPPAAPVWKFLPVPDEPDKHAEYDMRSMTSPEGMLILGARVRGRKHKHEGTNCDDWFECAVAGKWSILAVADGGGSYKFSRVGAQAACRGSVAFLEKEIANVAIKSRDQITKDSMNDEDIKAAVAALHGAMNAGWQAIEKEFKIREFDWRYVKLLQKPGQATAVDMTLRDMYSTLLLVIHTTIETTKGTRSIVVSCAGGDGMIALITDTGDCKLLMKPDSGEFAGEVEFLGKKMLNPSSLEGRTFLLMRDARAIMLMTDGVADDYFPSDPRMAELYVDLVLNGIIPVETVSEEGILSELKTTKLPDIESVQEADFLEEVDRLLEKPKKVLLASAKKYAEALGVEPHDLAKRPGLLAAAQRVRRKPMPGVSGPEERLLVWLDAYQVRGSFDDRTMIVMTGGSVV